MTGGVTFQGVTVLKVQTGLTGRWVNCFMSVTKYGWHLTLLLCFSVSEECSSRAFLLLRPGVGQMTIPEVGSMHNLRPRVQYMWGMWNVPFISPLGLTFSVAICKWRKGLTHRKETSESFDFPNTSKLHWVGWIKKSCYKLLAVYMGYAAKQWGKQDQADCCPLCVLLIDLSLMQVIYSNYTQTHKHEHTVW